MAGRSSHEDAHCTVSCLPRSEHSRDTQADRSMFLGDVGVLHSPVGSNTPQGHCRPFFKLGLAGNRDAAVNIISVFHSLSSLPHPLRTLPALADSLSISSHGCLLHGTLPHTVLLYSVYPIPPHPPKLQDEPRSLEASGPWKPCFASCTPSPEASLRVFS